MNIFFRYYKIEKYEAKTSVFDYEHLNGYSIYFSYLMLNFQLLYVSDLSL
jgi:hypothetical protein